MGMYDTIICEYPLPDGWQPGSQHGFQTKSLFNRMDSFTITKDGDLIQHYVEYEATPEEEMPYYGTDKWDKPFGKLVGSIRVVKGSEKDLIFGYNGVIIFYSFEGEHGDGCAPLDSGCSNDCTFKWHEYSAQFLNGKLQSLTVGRD
jgi:hypothetical protein